MKKVSAIIACAGKGERMNLGYNKMFYDVGGVPLFMKTLSTFLSMPQVSQIIITADIADFDKFAKHINTLDNKNIILSEGGATRTASVKNALSMLDADSDIILIHDGARPFVTTKIIEDCIACTDEYGACLTAVKTIDTLKTVVGGFITSTPERNIFYNAQTPQGFRRSILLDAYAKTSENFSDDCAVVERAGYPIKIIEGSYQNIKVTTPADLDKFLQEGYVVGNGFDTHQLVEGRKLILGGVDIPHTKGLLGHSDADVLTHAIMDSLLACAGARDIGYLFPDNDDNFKGISSLILLKKVANILQEKGLIIGNISAVIMAQKPKLSPNIPHMVAKIAEVLNIDIEKINISATTTEKLGFVGREEGISCSAISSCKKSNIARGLYD